MPKKCTVTGLDECSTADIIAVSVDSNILMSVATAI